MPIDRSKRNIIVDTDPGQDDAIAILFALAASDRLNLHAITTVAGNVPLEFTSRNARIVLDWANRPEVPVYAGSPRPLMRELVTAEQHVHGKTGLEGVPLHEPITGLQKAHAVDFLVSTLREAPDRSQKKPVGTGQISIPGFSVAVCAHGRKVSAHQFDPGSPLRVWGSRSAKFDLSLDPRSTVFPWSFFRFGQRSLIPRSCKLLALRSEIVIILELVLGLFVQWLYKELDVFTFPIRGTEQLSAEIYLDPAPKFFPVPRAGKGSIRATPVPSFALICMRTVNQSGDMPKRTGDAVSVFITQVAPRDAT